MYRENWLPRGLAVVGLTAAVMLIALAWPATPPSLPKTSPDTPLTKTSPTTTPTLVLAATDQAPTHSPTATTTSIALPTITPLFTKQPTNTPTPLPTATPTPTPTPSPTSTPPPSPTSPPAATNVDTKQNIALAGRVEQHAYPSQVTGGEEPYRIYLPPNYDQSEQRYPVLYLLHGWPYDESHWDNLGIDETADAGIVSGTLPSFIIVLPGADPEGLYVSTSGGDHSYEAQIVKDLIPYIDENYRTIPDRSGRAIGGISRGGVWSLEIGFRNAGLFAAVGAHSPALSANLAPPVYDPFNLLGEPGVATLRVYLSAGEGDWARKSTEDLHRALNEQEIDNQLAIHPGNHRDTLWAENVVEYLAFYTMTW